MRTNLKEKVALVTGASSGLGARFAKVLAANGARVVLAARRVERLKELRAEIEAAGGAAHVEALDVTDPQSIAACISQTEAAVGPIDILVNNSGVSTIQRLTDVTSADYDYVFDTNTKGAFFVAQAVARQMIARAKGQQDFRGRIVNIASVAGLRVLAQIGVYCMSKAAVVQMTKAQALEWGRYGINVNAICPGVTLTEATRTVVPEQIMQAIVGNTALKRALQPEDLTGTAVFLASGDSDLMTGQVLVVDGGMIMLG